MHTCSVRGRTKSVIVTDQDVCSEACRLLSSRFRPVPPLNNSHRFDRAKFDHGVGPRWRAKPVSTMPTGELGGHGRFRTRQFRQTLTCVARTQNFAVRHCLFGSIWDVRRISDGSPCGQGRIGWSRSSACPATDMPCAGYSTSDGVPASAAATTNPGVF